VEINTNTGTENVHSIVVPTIYAIDTTHITSIPGRMFPPSFDLGSLQPIQDIILSLDNYTFDNKTKTIVKRKTKKRKITHHEEITQETMQLWDVAHLNDEEFAKEAIDALGEFVSAKKWSMSRLSIQLKREKKKVEELQEKLKSHDTVWSEEHETQLDHLVEANKISLDTIA